MVAVASWPSAGLFFQAVGIDMLGCEGEASRSKQLLRGVIQRGVCTGEDLSGEQWELFFAPLD